MAQLVALKLEEEQLLPSQTKVTVIGSLVYHQLACGVGAVKVHFFRIWESPCIFFSLVAGPDQRLSGPERRGRPLWGKSQVY